MVERAGPYAEIDSPVLISVVMVAMILWFLSVMVYLSSGMTNFLASNNNSKENRLTKVNRFINHKNVACVGCCAANVDALFRTGFAHTSAEALKYYEGVNKLTISNCRDAL